MGSNSVGGALICGSCSIGSNQLSAYHSNQRPMTGISKAMACTVLTVEKCT